MSMSDLFSLINSLLNLALVGGAMWLIATAPAGFAATVFQALAGSADDVTRWSPSFTNDDDSSDYEHTVNIDGTPMCGDVDINGNVFGVTDDWLTDSCGGCGGMSSSMFD